jgi:hypothetical protein
VTDTADTSAGSRPPRTVVLAFAATIATVALTVISAALWWAYQNYLRHEFVRTNAKLKPTDKNHKTNYDLSPAHIGAVNHDVRNWLTSGLVQSLIFGLALVLIAVNMRRGKGWARWLLLILFAIPVLPTAAPYRLLSLGGSAPTLTRIVGALIGLCGLAVIVLLAVPETSRYFAAVRAEQQGERATGAARPGLRDLFSPRPRNAGTSRPEAARPSTPRAAGPARPEKPAATKPAPPRDKTPPSRDKTPPPDKPAPAETKSAPVAKAKARTGTEPSRPAASVAAKSRGKSRRGS